MNPTNPTNVAAGAYLQNAILNASPEKLVVLMYNGALRHLERARRLLEEGGHTHSADVGIALGKAMAILGELRATLDHDKGGEIARNLDRLYDFCLDRVYEGNVSRQSGPIAESIRVLKTLKEGFDAVVPC